MMSAIAARVGLLVGCIACVPAQPRAPVRRCVRPEHVVSITIDTLRADRLGAYGSTTVETPNMDRLAREGAMARMPRCTCR